MGCMLVFTIIQFESYMENMHFLSNKVLTIAPIAPTIPSQKINKSFSSAIKILFSACLENCLVYIVETF